MIVFRTVVLVLTLALTETCTYPDTQLVAPGSCSVVWKDDESHPLVTESFPNCFFEKQHIIATLDNGVDWEIWENPNETGGHVYDLGKATFYGGYATNGKASGAYKAEWSNSGDFISRAGLQFEKVDPGDSTKMKKGCSYTAYGAMTAEYRFTKSGQNTAGGYSYVGIYGWARNPLVEFYIIDDWFGNDNLNSNSFPVPPTVVCNDVYVNECKIGEYELDGGTYLLYSKTRGPAYSISGPNKCFTQIYAVRTTTRQCGTIHIDQHFAEWAKSPYCLVLNEMYEAKILVEAGGGAGWIDFTHLTVTKEHECTTGESYVGGPGNYPTDTYSCPLGGTANPNVQIQYGPLCPPDPCSPGGDGAEKLWNKKAWVSMIVLWVVLLLWF